MPPFRNFLGKKYPEGLSKTHIAYFNLSPEKTIILLEYIENCLLAMAAGFFIDHQFAFQGVFATKEHADKFV